MSDLGARIATVLADRPERIAAAWLFGSRASGRARADSDVDVAILMLDEPPETLDGMGFDVAAALEEQLDVPVDLVILNRAPAELVHYVLRGGELVHETDASRRVAFEVRARAEYFDLKPILDEYRRVREPEVRP